MHRAFQARSPSCISMSTRVARLHREPSVGLRAGCSQVSARCSRAARKLGAEALELGHVALVALGRSSEVRAAVRQRSTTRMVPDSSASRSRPGGEADLAPSGSLALRRGSISRRQVKVF